MSEKSPARQRASTSFVLSLVMVSGEMTVERGGDSRAGLWWVATLGDKTAPPPLWFYEARGPIHCPLCVPPWSL